MQKYFFKNRHAKKKKKAQILLAINLHKNLAQTLK